MKCRKCYSDNLTYYISDEDTPVLASTCLECGDVIEYFELSKKKKQEISEDVLESTKVTT